MKTILFNCIALCFVLSAYAQVEDSNEKVNPYDLMSQYYDQGFQPFGKGKWYTGFAFSLTDRKLENTQRLFDKVIDGKDFNYDLTFKGGVFHRRLCNGGSEHFL